MTPEGGTLIKEECGRNRPRYLSFLKERKKRTPQGRDGSLISHFSQCIQFSKTNLPPPSTRRTQSFFLPFWHQGDTSTASSIRHAGLASNRRAPDAEQRSHQPDERGTGNNVPDQRHNSGESSRAALLPSPRQGRDHPTSSNPPPHGTQFPPPPAASRALQTTSSSLRATS